MARRNNLTNLLDNMDDMGEFEFHNLFDELETFVEDTRDIVRWHAASTQKREDHDLSLYLSYAKQLAKRHSRKQEEVSEAEAKEFAFPEDHKQLYKNLKMFLAFAFLNARPRARASGDRIEYRSLSKYRQSMLFWCKRTYLAKGITPPPHGKLNFEMTEAMRLLQKRYGINPLKRKRFGCGEVELLQLLDHDMSNNYCIEFSEQQWIAWCVAFQTAIRPGSLGRGEASDRQEYSRLRDLDLSRGQERGRFNLILTIRILKTNTNNMEQGVKGKHVNIALDMPLTTPQAKENIIFSVPHRILAMLLRRGALEGITSVAELINGTQQNITIKSSMLDEPMFYRAGPRGQTLDRTGPLSAAGLTVYLQRIGLNLGYVQPLTFYDFRRRAAVELYNVLGPDRTRIIMGHSPESCTLERYYVNLFSSVNLTGLALKETPATSGPSSMAATETHGHAATRISPELLLQRGLALNAMVSKLISEDPKFPTDKHEQRLYMRRVRRIAFHAVHEETAKIQKQTITIEQAQARADDIMNKASSFTSNLLASARRRFLMQQEPSPIPEEQDFDFDQEFPEPQTFDAPEPDVEDLAKTITSDTRIRVDVPANNESAVDSAYLTSILPDASKDVPVDQIPYSIVASTFIQAILDNTASQFSTWQATDTTCPLCQSDATIKDADKNRSWKSQAKLRDHLRSRTHSKAMIWRRQAEESFLLRLESRDPLDTSELEYLCPFCPADDPSGYSNIDNLIRHIKSSTPESGASVEHDDLKREAGWYDADFSGTISTEGERLRVRRSKKKMADQGYVFNPEPEIYAALPTTEERLVFGAFVNPDLRLDGLISSSADDVLAWFDNNPAIGQTMTSVSERQITGYLETKPPKRTRVGSVDELPDYLRLTKRRLDPNDDNEEDGA